MLTQPAPLATEHVLAGCTVDLVGVPARLSAGEADGADALAGLFRAARPSAEAPLVSIHATMDDVALPAVDPDVSTDEFDMWRDDGTLYVRQRRGVVARLVAGAVTIGGRADSYPVVFRRTALTVLPALLAPHDVQLVHAAAIARGERAVLVLGTSGAGKSTLAFCALRGGWDVLSDDLVGVRGEGAALAVTGVPRPFAVPTELLDDGVTVASALGEQRRRRELPADVVAHGWRGVAGIVVVEHGEDARGELERIDAHSVLRGVLSSWSPSGGAHDLAAILPPAAELARRPALVLRLGREVEARVADAVSLLERAGDELGCAP
ncbi:MAG TPA: hypothetical protein VEP49_02915 [Acidimicrobiia bacterium]|nr:hypothetical protein [Acidimicrobiia bacterium]